ncbi:MAG: hypothetical protein V7724_01115 [Sediminicola sp.]
MNSIIVLLSFLAFYLFYLTSKKAIIQRTSNLEVWAGKQRKVAKSIGALLLLICFVAMVLRYGLAPGILAQCIVLMTVASLIICVAPLRIINFKLLSLVMLGCFLLEITLS